MKDGKVIVILGMHRSGTSAIARCLDVFGIGLGENLHPPAVDNPKGFWEDRDCLEINEALLAHLNSSYDRMGLAWNLSEHEAKIASLKNRAITLISSKLRTHNGLWGFKDPRTCRLLTFWQDVFRSVGCDANYIIALRNPMNVASSLKKRNQIPFEKSYFLWLQHMLPSVLQTEGSSRVIVNFDSLLKQPIAQLSRIASYLDLDMPDLNSDAIRSYVDDFLDINLRHNSFSMAELESDNRATPDTIAAYKLLIFAAEGSPGSDDEKLSNGARQIYDRLKELSPLFDYSNFLEKELASLQDALSAKSKDIDQLQQACAWHKQQADAWHAKAEECDTRYTEIHSAHEESYQWMTEQRNSWEAVAREGENKLAGLASIIERLNAEQLWLNQRRDDWEAIVQQYADDNEAVKMQLKQATKELEELKSRLVVRLLARVFGPNNTHTDHNAD